MSKASVLVSDEIDAPVERVWELLKDFGDISAWAPAATRVEVEGSGIGMVRKVSAGGTDFIHERLVSMDADTHQLSYAIDEGPMPFGEYLACVRLEETESGGTGIEWSSEFVPIGLAEEKVVAMLEGLYRGFIASLRSSLS